MMHEYGTLQSTEKWSRVRIRNTTQTIVYIILHQIEMIVTIDIHPVISIYPTCLSTDQPILLPSRRTSQRNLATEKTPITPLLAFHANNQPNPESNQINPKVKSTSVYPHNLTANKRNESIKRTNYRLSTRLKAPRITPKSSFGFSRSTTFSLLPSSSLSPSLLPSIARRYIAFRASRSSSRSAQIRRTRDDTLSDMER